MKLNEPVRVPLLTTVITWVKGHPVVSIVIVSLLVISVLSSPSAPKNESAGVDVPEAEKAPAATTEQPVPRRDIGVTSQTVKVAGKKYRYFFDIRNNDVAAFDGAVTIELTQEKGNVLGKETFSTKRPIEPGFGDSVYMDLNSGPVPYFDLEYAITGYRYEVLTEGNTVAEGSGEIVVPETLERS